MNRTAAHVHFGVCSRGKGRPLARRFHYQQARDYVDATGKIEKFGDAAEHHLGTAVLLPTHVPDELAEPLSLSNALIAREGHSKAQEAFHFDVALPRSVNPGEELLVSAWALLPLVRAGMCLQVDAECPSATDSKRHPHGHAYGSMRSHDGKRFVNDKKEWSRRLRRNHGKHLRCQIASRLTAASALLGRGYVVDPRQKRHWSNVETEPRIPSSLWGNKERLQSFPAYRQVVSTRNEQSLIVDTSHDDPIADVSNPAWLDLNGDELFLEWKAYLATAEHCGWQVQGVACFGQDVSLLKEGCNICLSPSLHLLIFSDYAEDHDWDNVVQLLARANWPALVVRGASEAVNELGVRGVRIGLMPINVPLSERALERIGRPGGRILAEDLAPYDRRGSFVEFRTAPSAQMVVEPDVANEVADFNDFRTPQVKKRSAAEIAEQQARARRAETANKAVADPIEDTVKRMSEKSAPADEPDYYPRI